MKTNSQSSASLFKYPNDLVSSTIKHAVSSATLVEFYSFRYSSGEYAGGIAGVQPTCAHCASLCCLHTMKSGLIRWTHTRPIAQTLQRSQAGYFPFSSGAPHNGLRWMRPVHQSNRAGRAQSASVLRKKCMARVKCEAQGPNVMT